MSGENLAEADCSDEVNIQYPKRLTNLFKTFVLIIFVLVFTCLVAGAIVEFTIYLFGPSFFAPVKDAGFFGVITHPMSVVTVLSGAAITWLAVDSLFKRFKI